MGESDNHTTFTPSTKWETVPRYSRLSPTTMNCLTMVVNGLNTKEIASALALNPNSVHDYLSRAYRTLRTLDGVGESLPTNPDRRQVAQTLIANGFFEPVKTKE